jgi:putative oxidoreductase
MRSGWPDQRNAASVIEETIKMTQGSLFSRNNPQTTLTGYVALPLRLIVGYGFVEHGMAKWFKGPDTFAAILHALGVPAPHLMAWLTIGTEILSGIAILLGAFVSLVGIPTIILVSVAIVTVHLPYGFSSIKLMSVTAGRAQFGPPGYECDLLYIACILALVLSGPSPLSIDAYRLRKGRAALG